MDLVERYIYAVTKRLPANQRDEMEKELDALINDLLERYETRDEQTIEKVLLELGSPRELANQYREKTRYLIGPEYFEYYLLVLQIVAGATFAGLTIAYFTSMVFSQNELPSFNTPIDYIGSLLSALFQVFAWVTIVFAINEHLGFRHNHDKAFKLSDLPVKPKGTRKISKAECIVSIFFSTLFFIIMIGAPEVFSAYFLEGSSMTVISVFDLTTIKAYTFVFVALFFLNLVKEVIKFVIGHWTLSLALFMIIFNILTTILTLTFFMNADIWNPNFAKELASHFNNIDANIPEIWDRLTRLFIPMMIVFGAVVDMISTLVKGLKSSRSL